MRKLIRLARRSRGSSTFTALVAVAVVLFTGFVWISLSGTSLVLSRDIADEYVARNLAEAGLHRAMAVAAVMPAWGQSATPHHFDRTVPIDDRVEGRYEVTVRGLGTTTPDGYPLIGVLSTGRFRNETYTIDAQIYVQPAPFLAAGLSLYREHDARGSLDVLGPLADLYVSGPFRHQSGRVCVEGNLLAHEILAPEPREGNACTGAGRGGEGNNKTVLGSITEGLTRETYRSRPINPANWYRWAEQTVWENVYGRDRDPAGMPTFQEILDRAQSADFPYGVFYFIDGDYTLADSHPPGQGYNLPRGLATVVVAGKLRVEAHQITTGDPTRYPEDDASHIALISLGGIEFDPGSPGPFEALFYTYDTNPQASEEEEKGRYTFGNRGPSGSLRIYGTLAGASVQEQVGMFEIYTNAKVKERAAPGIPGMKAVLYNWELGGTAGDKYHKRWGLD